MPGKFRREGKFFVYIVKCADGTYYTGYTNDLAKRLKRHNNGLASKYTRARLPVILVWKKEYRQYKSAFKAETAIKKLTRRQKEALVGGKDNNCHLKQAKVTPRQRIVTQQSCLYICTRSSKNGVHTARVIILDSRAFHGKMSTNWKCPLNSGHLGVVDI